MKAEVLTIGDELLRGEIIDSNKALLSQRLLDLDIETRFHTSVRDDPPDMRDAFRRAASRCDCVLVSGGLGPTRDDLTAQVLAKSFSSALLLIASPNYFLAFMVGDHVLYQLYLAARGDHRDCRPGFGVFSSAFARIGQKVVVDFTGCWLMRNPLVMHNAYFLFNQLTAHASVFVSVHVYVSGGGNDLDERMLWVSSGALFGAWAVTYVVRARAKQRCTPIASARASQRRPRLIHCSLAGTSSWRAWPSLSTATCSTPQRPQCSTHVRSSKLRPTK